MNRHNPHRPSPDLVCGTMTSKSTAAASCNYNGTILYFCSMSCHDKFLKRPRRYLRKRCQRGLIPRMSLPINGMRGFHPL
jgi:YHS domain-containing protein